MLDLVQNGWTFRRSKRTQPASAFGVNAPLERCACLQGFTEQSRSAAKDLILDIIAAAGGEMHGVVRLNKAFYFAHVIYWQNADGVLTDYPIIRMPEGPGIDRYQTLLLELAEERQIAIDKEQVGPYFQEVYRLTARRELEANSRTAAIAEAIELVRNARSAAELSDMIHAQSRSWQTTPDGRELDIYTDLATDTELARIRAEIAAFRPHSPYRREAAG